MHTDPNISHLDRADWFAARGMPREAINAARCHGWYNHRLHTAIDTAFRLGHSHIGINVASLMQHEEKLRTALAQQRMFIRLVARANTKWRALTIHADEGRLAKCIQLLQLVAFRASNEQGYVNILVEDYLQHSPFAYHNPIEEVYNANEDFA